ncbi:MAG: AbrB/MazE/SpoVT family DNA-binding domain-containing protein [Candidatus Wallacebacter cryptica]|nr:AbrB/MazE/SpoVT family DNA-binding domain-containing protein [Bacillota bacterium]
MIVELRDKSQITIPAKIIKNLGLSVGDRFEIIEKDGGIFLCPVVVYPKAKMKKIAELIREAELESDTLKTYDDVDEMFKEIGIDLDEI